MNKTQEVIIAGIWRATNKITLDAHMIIMNNIMPEPGSTAWLEIEELRQEVIANNFLRVLH